MKKLSKTTYNKIVKAKILNTGLYNGRHVEEAEICDELYEHLQDIKQDYKKGVLTAFNADAHIAYNYFKYEDSDYTSDDFNIYLDNDDYTNDLKLFLGSKH